MLKKIILVIILLAVGENVQAQHRLTDQIESLNWSIIGMIRFKKISDKEIYPIYSDEVSRFADRNFELKGYMIPVKAKGMHTSFMLATLPLNQCYFCGKNGVPIMIVVNMAKPIKFTWAPIVVTGILKLTKDNATVTSPAKLINATLSD